MGPTSTRNVFGLYRKDHVNVCVYRRSTVGQVECLFSLKPGKPDVLVHEYVAVIPCSVAHRFPVPKIPIYYVHHRYPTEFAGPTMHKAMNVYSASLQETTDVVTPDEGQEENFWIQGSMPNTWTLPDPSLKKALKNAVTDNPHLCTSERDVRNVEKDYSEKFDLVSPTKICFEKESFYFVYACPRSNSNQIGCWIKRNPAFVDVAKDLTLESKVKNPWIAVLIDARGKERGPFPMHRGISNSDDFEKAKNVGFV